MTESALAIGLINPKSPTNLGAIMRAAGCYQVDEVVYTGTRYDRAAKYRTNTNLASSNIPLNHIEHILGTSPEDRAIVCVEYAEGAIPLPAFQHPSKAIYVFGPEDGTIPQNIINKASSVVYIPTIGCMNLAATVNVVLYDRLAKSELENIGDDFVRQHRDTNNNIIVKD